MLRKLRRSESVSLDKPPVIPATSLSSSSAITNTNKSNTLPKSLMLKSKSCHRIGIRGEMKDEDEEDGNEGMVKYPSDDEDEEDQVIFFFITYNLSSLQYKYIE